jgi:DNA-binding transcriptional LysR family regulator
MTLGSDETIKQAVAAGLGLAVLSRHVVTPGADEGLTELDVVGFPIVRRWHVVHLADKRLSPLARAFLQLLKDSRRPSAGPAQAEARPTPVRPAG